MLFLNEHELVFSMDNRDVIYGKLAKILIDQQFSEDPSLSKAMAVICTYSVIDKKDLLGKNMRFIGQIKEVEEDYRIARNFLKGVRITRNEANRLGFEDRELSDKMIIDYAIRAFVNVYKSQGCKMLFLLVDQFERVIEQLPTRTMLGLLDSYRSLIDRNLENFSAIFACTTESWFESASAYGSFKDRFTDPVVIPKITLEIAQKLVIAYCDSFRLSDEHKGSLFPFDKDSILFILRKSLSTRDFIENCHMILLKASLKQQSGINSRNIQDLFE
jgi:hypothetical protein